MFEEEEGEDVEDGRGGEEAEERVLWELRRPPC